MMEYLIGENKYSICCNCYQSPPKVDNKEYRTRWNKHFKEVDNGYRPHDTKVEHMVRQLYNRDWL